MKKIKIAQIGMSQNSHGWNIFETLKELDDVFEIVGYALPENEREKFPGRMNVLEGYKELSIEEILNNPEIEAVAVETEEIYLVKYAQMAADKKKHIHMEKPGGIDLNAFEKLIDTVKKNGTVFHIGYMYRYNPVIKNLINEVRCGEFGDIISVEAQMGCLHPAQTRQWLGTFPGGMLFFLGCHLIDLILQIQGTPQNIIPLSKSTGKDGVTADDFGMAVFEYKNGVSFAKTNAVEIGGFSRRQLVVTGTKKMVEIKPLEIIAGDDQYTDITSYTGTGWCDEGEKTRSESYNRYADMLISFAKMSRGEMNNPYSYDYELELYKTILRACGK